MSGLVDKLEGVHVGDLILLKSPAYGLEVAGYVCDYSASIVRLSVPNPNKPGRKGTGWGGFRARWHVGSRDDARRYELKYFDEYEILKQAVRESDSEDEVLERE